MKKMAGIKAAVVAGSFVSCCAGTASAASLDELTPFLSGQHFNWEEFNDGRRILKENGILYSGGVVVGAAFDSGFHLKAKGEIFGGEMDYSGETQEPVVVPVSTDVSYFGIREELDAGYRVPDGRFLFEPFAGMGYRWWLRDLHDSTTSGGSPVTGYTEYWQTFYGRIGARGRYQADSGFTVFVEGGGKYPFYNANTVDLGGDDLTLHPGRRWSAFAEAGCSYKHLKVTVNYEGFRFAESPRKTVGLWQYFQPESSSDIIGASIGWKFR